MNNLLAVTHIIEQQLDRRLTDSEYNKMVDFLSKKARKESIEQGLSELNEWANKLPQEVKNNILKGRR